MSNIEQNVTQDIGLVRTFIKNHPYWTIAGFLVLANLIGVVTGW